MSNNSENKLKFEFKEDELTPSEYQQYILNPRLIKIKKTFEHLVNIKEPVCIVFDDKYLSGNAEVVIFEKVYDNFVFGHTQNTHNPYTISFNTLLCEDYNLFLPKDNKIYLRLDKEEEKLYNSYNDEVSPLDDLTAETELENL